MSISPLRVALVAGGGALLAAWLAAATTTPGQDVPVSTPTVPVVSPPQPGGPGSTVAADLAADLERLRSRVADAPALRVGARNPFSLAPAPPPLRATAPDASREPVSRRTLAGPPRRAGPELDLIGVASSREEGSERTGILIAPDGGVLLVGVGDNVPGGYLVDAVEPSSVTLVDGGGTRYRLTLPR